MNVLVALILAASLLLGGGATVVAAQDDLPNQPLYQLKLWTENAALAMNADPQEQANLLMNMAQNRVQEIAALAGMGATPPEQVPLRLEQHLRQTLQLAAGMDDETREPVLLQLQERLRTQERIMEQLQTHANPETELLLTRTRQMLQAHLLLVEEGLANPQGFRYMIQNQMQYGQDEEISPEPNQQGEPGFHQNGTNGQPGEGPGSGNGSSNDTPGEPNPDRSQNGNDGKGSDHDSGGGSDQGDSKGGNDCGSCGDGGDYGGSSGGGGNGGGGGN
jgi:hypothetical protein